MEAIVSIASILDAPVVCEGVETDEQLAVLAALYHDGDIASAS